MQGPFTTVEDGASLPFGLSVQGVLWSVLVASVGYLGFALFSGWGDVSAAARRISAVDVGIVLMLSLTNYGLRFIRWHSYLRAMDHVVPCWPSLRVYIAGFALTTTPGKAGELIRGLLLHRWSVPYTCSAAGFVSERLSDLLAIVVLAMVGLSAFLPVQSLTGLGFAVVAVAFVAVLQRPLIGRLFAASDGSTRRSRLLRHLSGILLQSRRCHTPAIFAAATGFALVAWAAEGWALHILLLGIGVDMSPAASIFVYAASLLAGALSFMPGGLGSAEAVMVALLIWQGCEASEAVAATIVIRLATLWFALALGCLALAYESTQQSMTVE